MSSPRYARVTSRFLARYAGSACEDPPSPEARGAAVALMERAIAARARAHNVTRWTAALGAAAAIGATLGAWREIHRPSAVTTTSTHAARPPQSATVVAYPLGAGASLWLDGSRVPLSEGGNLAPGSRVETPANGRAAFAFASGTNGILGESGDLTVAGDDAMQVLRLDSGWVDLHVAKVLADRRFLVSTPDADVEVRGTKFRVSLGPSNAACGDRALTHIVVTEGVVIVRHAGADKRVAAGEQWSSDCAPPVETAASALPSALPSANTESIASTLGAQNDLFAAGILATHRGDRQIAIGTFDRFLALYPGSPLAQSAAVERMRLLRLTLPAQAVAAARQYLALYPNGFAYAEAEAIAEGPR
jgi:ferric-dicitrate binding protein FerR (iron transport regulator)